MLLAFIGVSATSVRADEASFEMQVLGDSRKVRPGEVTTLAFRITNLRYETRRFAVEATLPSEWQLVVPLADLDLESGEQKVLLLHVRVAARALPGMHELYLRVSAGEVPDESRHEPVKVEVLPVYGLDLRLEGVPRFMQPGVAYSAGLVATNGGNVSASVQLDGTMSKWASLQFVQTALTLGAWETRRVEVSITPVSTERGGDRVLVVQGHTADVADPVQATQPVILIASAHAETAAPVSFPVEIGVGTTRGSRGVGGELSASGRGVLWEDADHDIEFDVRMRDSRQYAVLGRRDEYRVRFRSDRLSLQLGDHTYALSPLTDSGRRGFGAAASLRMGNAGFGALYSRSRMNIFGDSQYGVHAGYSVGSSSLVGIQVIGRDGLRAGQAFTVRAATRIAGGTDIDAEIGRSGDGTQASSAYQVQLAGRYSWLSYDARLIHVGPSGIGLHSNIDLRDFRVRAQPWKGLQIDGGWLDIAEEAHPIPLHQQRTYHAGATLSENVAQRRLFVRLEWTDRADRMYAREAVQERGLALARLQTGINAPSGGIQASAELGRSVMGNRSRPSHAVRMNGHLTRPRSQMNVAVTYRTGAQPHHRFATNEWSFDAGLESQIGLRTRATIHGQLLSSRGPQAITTALFSSRLSHTFPGGHEITFEGRYRAFGNATLTGRDSEISLGYAIPIGVPIPSKRVGSDVSGRIYDGETGEPLAGIVLHLARSVALSDQDGKFAFKRLPKGVFLLEPNGASIGLGRIAMQGHSIEVQVHGTDVTDLEVAIVRSAAIEGRAVVYDNEPRQLGQSEPRPLIERGGLADALVEITDGDERLLATTGADGRFIVSGLRPGKWTVHVVSGDIPAGHYIAEFPSRLDLSPGDKAQVEIGVMPQTRQLRIIERGTVD